MPDTSQVRALRKKNHLSYDWWQYLLFSTVLCVLVVLAFMMGRYTIPGQYVVDVFVVGEQVELVYEMEELEAEIMPTLPDDQQDITFAGLMWGSDVSAGEGGNTIEGYMGAQMGDVFIMPEDAFRATVERCSGLMLDEYIENGMLTLPDDSWTEIGIATTVEDSTPHIYAISASGLQGLYRYGYNAENAVLLVASYTDNPENAVRVADWLLNNLQEPRFRSETAKN